MEQGVIKLINEYTDTATIQRVENVSNQIIYRCINKSNPKYVGSLVFTPSMEALYFECNGYTNKKYSRGEALDLSDIKNFIEAVRFAEPTIRKSGLLKKKAIVLGELTLDSEL